MTHRLQMFRKQKTKNRETNKILKDKIKCLSCVIGKRKIITRQSECGSRSVPVTRTHTNPFSPRLYNTQLTIICTTTVHSTYIHIYIIIVYNYTAKAHHLCFVFLLCVCWCSPRIVFNCLKLRKLNYSKTSAPYRCLIRLHTKMWCKLRLYICMQTEKKNSTVYTYEFYAHLFGLKWHVCRLLSHSIYTARVHSVHFHHRLETSRGKSSAKRKKEEEYRRPFFH